MPLNNLLFLNMGVEPFKDCFFGFNDVPLQQSIVLFIEGKHAQNIASLHIQVFLISVVLKRLNSLF